MEKPIENRVPVNLTPDERDLIEAAMKVLGHRAMSEFMRTATLAAAREALE